MEKLRDYDALDPLRLTSRTDGPSTGSIVICLKSALARARAKSFAKSTLAIWIWMEVLFERGWKVRGAAHFGLFLSQPPMDPEQCGVGAIHRKWKRIWMSEAN